MNLIFSTAKTTEQYKKQKWTKVEIKLHNIMMINFKTLLKIFQMKNKKSKTRKHKTSLSLRFAEVATSENTLIEFE